jgi:hypothetical protein
MRYISARLGRWYISVIDRSIHTRYQTKKPSSHKMRNEATMDERGDGDVVMVEEQERNTSLPPNRWQH